MTEPPDQPKLKQSQIDFVLVQLQEDDPRIQNNIDAAYDIAQRYGADVEFFGSLIMITFGTLVDDAPRDNRPEKVRAELAQRFKSAAKILYGSDVGRSGFLVGEKHVKYTFVLPYFTEARHRVGRLAWGEVVEFQKGDPG